MAKSSFSVKPAVADGRGRAPIYGRVTTVEATRTSVASGRRAAYKANVRRVVEKAKRTR